MKGKKLEPPLYIDMDTDEALARFIQTDPKEVKPVPRRPKATRPKPGGPKGEPSS